ncbi:MAG: hypothetical protein E6H04_13705 [Bacillati bacterium ANGP1]|uniref:Oligopeptide transport permease C-like N-terminal domain-containing protein n=1 Tax=Candidatus Segetimicrobium genomatis TaxID=2569760 RepID=A0A537J298_9BACT|nr:MAG: hypothetical protein E6H04_13705 [Terrabacteria group bacterium ANGP1]
MGRQREPAARHPRGHGVRAHLLRPARHREPLRGRPVRGRGPADPAAVSAVRTTIPAISLSRAPAPPRTAETGWHRTVRRFRKNPTSMLGLLIVAFFVAVALLAPFGRPARGTRSGRPRSSSTSTTG